MNQLFYSVRYIIPFVVTYLIGTLVLNFGVAWAGCDCPENDAQSFVIMVSALIVSVLSVLITYFLTKKMKFWLAVLVGITLSVLLLSSFLGSNVNTLRNQVLPYFQK